MAGTLFENNLSPSLTMVEQGSTPASPAAGNQRLFIRTSDHLLCYVNSGGTVTPVAGSGAITSSGYTQNTARILGRTTASAGAIEEITIGANLTLSAGSLSATGGSGATTPITATDETATITNSVPRPELADHEPAHTIVSMAGAATGTGVTQNTLADTCGRIVFTNASYQYCDVASAIGTGDFDIRARIMYSADTTTGGLGLFYFGVTDSSRTSTTGLYVRFLSMFVTSNQGGSVIQAYTGLGTTAISPAITGYIRPFVARVVRVGTTVTRYVSFTEGLSWITLGASTSSLDVAKIGFWAHPNGSTVIEVIPQWVMTVP